MQNNGLFSVNGRAGHNKTARLVLLALLSALTIIFTFFMIPVGPFELTLAAIPVAVGAILLGPAASTFLGFLFGMCSFITCFGISPLGVLLLAENAFFTFLVCVPTRMLMGFLVGWIFRLLMPRFEHIPAFPITVTAFAAAVLNTIFFVGTLILLFWNGKTITDLMQNAGVTSVIGLIGVFITLNAVVEAAVSMVIGAGLSGVLLYASKAKRS